MDTPELIDDHIFDMTLHSIDEASERWLFFMEHSFPSGIHLGDGAQSP